MHKKLFIILIVFFSLSVVSGFAESSQRTLLDKMLYSRDSSFGGLKDIGSNGDFFGHEISRSNLDSIKNVIGEKLFTSMNLNFEEGKSVQDFIDSNKSVLRSNPFVMAALVHNITKEDDISLQVEVDGSQEEVDFHPPARTLSAEDLYHYAQGPDGSPRNFREFLARNYGLENKPPVDRPDQIDAFSVFFNYAGPVKDGSLPSDSDHKELLTDRFVRDAGRGDSSAPDEDSPGLFLPSSKTLDEMAALLSMYKELDYALSNGGTPDLSSIDSDTLQKFLDASGVTDVSDIRNLSLDSIRQYMSGLVEEVVKNELKENDYVAEVSSVAVGSEDAGSNSGSSDRGNSISSSSFVNPTFVVGNNEATNEVNMIYTDVMAPMTESQRTRMEMENGGLFHINGNPDDVQEGGKLYHFLGTPDISDGFLSLMERPREAASE